MEEIEIDAAVDLRFQKLELGDLARCLAVGPRIGDRGFDGATILGNPAREFAEETARRVDQPSIEDNTRL